MAAGFPLRCSNTTRGTQTLYSHIPVFLDSIGYTEALGVERVGPSDFYR